MGRGSDDETEREPALIGTPSAPAYVAPRSPTEHLLVRVWLAVLGVDRVGIYDNFVDLGGESISAQRCVSRIRSAIDVDVPVEAFFTQEATIAALAEFIESTGLRPDRRI